jgi:hypothetical protein
VDVKNNPAGRLHDLLRAAQQQPGKEPARKVWSAVFSVDATDTGALLKMLADLIDLVDETKKAIGRLQDVDHQLYLKPFKKLETLLSQINLEAGWEHWRQQLDEPTLYGLQFSADRLARESGYTHIDNDELAQLRKDVEDLVARMLDADLPDSLKALFLRNLEAIRHALLAYRIRGIDGLQQEIERSVGSIILHKEQISSASTNSPQGGVWKSFFELIARLHQLVALARNSKELAVPALAAITQLFK